MNIVNVWNAPKIIGLHLSSITHEGHKKIKYKSWSRITSTKQSPNWQDSYQQTCIKHALTFYIIAIL